MADPEPEIDPLVQRARARIGQVLRAKWRIDRLLGVGGMAAVYEGVHRNGKRGAIKLLHPEIAMDAEARRRFLQEGYAANRVEHPGVVSVLDDDVTEDGSVFLVMELLEGRSVGEVASMQPGDRLDVTTTLTIADQVLDVLASAHERGIVHRDLKPDNLFMIPNGTVKVLDFGLARLQEHGSAGTATRTGNLMGTPAFMAPEQALGNWSEVDGRTDLWAVGATMFTLLTGRLVHQAATLPQLMLAAMTKPAPPLRSIQADVPAAIAAVIDRALAFDRHARWPDARSMQLALRAASQVTPGLAAGPHVVLAAGAARGVTSPSLLGATHAVVPGGRRPRARLTALVAGSVGAVLVGVISVVAFVSRGHAPSTPVAVAAPPEEHAPTTTLAVPPPPVVVAAPSAIASGPPVAPVASSAPSSVSVGRAAPSAASAPAAVAATSKPVAPPRVTGDPFGGGFH